MKKRNLIQKLTLLLGVFLLISSCSKTPETISVIPANAQAVTVFNIPLLFQKGNLLSNSNLETIQQLRNNKKTLKIEEQQLVDLFFENPLSLGLNFEKDWFSFYIHDSDEKQFFCVSASLINENSFTDFITQYLKNTNNKTTIQETKNCKLAFIDINFALAWDKEKLVIITTENLELGEKKLTAKLEELFTLKSSNQLIVNNRSFIGFYKNKKDVSLWLSSTVLKDDIEIKQLVKEYDLDISDNYVSFFLAFNEGSVQLDAYLDGSDNLEKILSKSNFLNDKFNTELLAFFTSDNLGIVTLSLDTKAIYENIKDNDYVIMANKMSTVSPQDFLESIGGSFALSISGIKTNDAPEGSYEANQIRPITTFTFDLKEAKIMDSLIRILPENTLQNLDGYFKFNGAGLISEDYFLAYNSKACIVTNDENLVIDFKNSKTFPNDPDSRLLALEIGRNAVYANLPLDLEKYNTQTKKQLEKDYSRSAVEFLTTLSQLSESIDFKLSKQNKASVKLLLKEQKENSLSILIQTMSKNFK